MVTSTGFGRHKNLPKEVYVSDGKLRVIKDTVHSWDTCKRANDDAMSEYFDTPREILEHMILPEKHICAGGDSVWSTCNGDSGGPVFADFPTVSSDPILVGVTSFGPSGFCGISPDYSARVSS
ncbi:MAG: trypsin-like serine protease, partial [bacterium]